MHSINLTPEEELWLTEHPNVTLALDGYFPPYSFLNSEGQIEGFAVDIFKLITDKTGLSFNLHPEHEWNLLYQSAKDKRVDIVATMVNLPDRQKWFNFSQPYVHKSLVIVTQNSNTEIQKKNDIAGKRLALVKGYQYVSELLSTYPDIKPIYVDTLLDALEAVAIGDADGTISFLGATHYYRNKYTLGNLNYALFFDKKNANESIAVREDWPELASILSKALRSIPEQKKLELLHKWLPFEYVESLAEINFTDEEQAWLRQNKPIRLGIDPEFAPFEYVEDGIYKGISSDYVALLNERLGIQLEVVPNLSWEEVIDKAKQGEIDVLAAVGKTEERQHFLDYTPAYLKFHRVIVTRENMPFISGLNDLKGMSIAVHDNSSHHGFLKVETDIKPMICPTRRIVCLPCLVVKSMPLLAMLRQSLTG
jgi:ABC-type amino acid transport substrate-binding protein